MTDKKPTATEITAAVERIRTADLALADVVAARAALAEQFNAEMTAADETVVDAVNEQSEANSALRALMDRM